MRPKKVAWDKTIKSYFKKLEHWKKKKLVLNSERSKKPLKIVEKGRYII